MSRLLVDEQVAKTLTDWLYEKHPDTPAPPPEQASGYYAKLASWLMEHHPDMYKLWPPRLYYNDDISQPDPPEDHPGHYGDIGFMKEVDEFVKGLPDALPKFENGIYRMTSLIYCIPGYELGDEVRYLNIMDDPLLVTVEQTKP